MSTAIELPLERIDGIDRERAARASFIDDHARHFFRRVFPSLPAIHVRVATGSITATAVGNLVPIAKELGHRSIQAIVDADSNPNAVAELLAEPGVRRLGEADLFPDEDPFEPRWHVLFFSGPLTAGERDLFGRMVLARFEARTGPDGRPGLLDVNALDDGQGLEFRAIMPVGDEGGRMGFVAGLHAFHQNVKPIVSYQGRVFAPPEPRP